MKFHPFVLPFTIGLAFVIVYVLVKWGVWIYQLPKEDKIKIKKNFLSPKTLWASWEVFLEGLVHRNIFSRNFLFGFLHMSLAMGWFLLIVVGNLETKVFAPGLINPPYYPIFFEFFNHDLPRTMQYRKLFTVVMDSLLLLVLSGVALVFFKRIKSSIMGMNRTTRHTFFDRMAMTTLWLIFPLRLLAEAVTSGIHERGDFLTGNLGELLAANFQLKELYMPVWWAYSIALGVFFVALPFSRYMHIPTEILLIFLRRYGVREKDKHTSVSQIEINSCPRCGICIDTCQLSSDLNIKDTQPTYFIRSLRRHNPTLKITDTCMMCMRCVEACPVGIEITSIRVNQRKENQFFKEMAMPSINLINIKPAKVAFFAGCMGHLTPSVIKATLKLFEEAGVDYNFIDKEGSICCGKPLQQIGEELMANSLMLKNAELIARSGAELLVTTCPICAKVFSESYNLKIPVYHHSQFLLDQVRKGKLHFQKSEMPVAFHDPCELGRGLGVYDEPRELLSHAVSLVENDPSRNHSLCCGGSLGITNISAEQRRIIAGKTLDKITAGQTKTVATGCPMCKKTFKSVGGEFEVLDIAEILIGALPNQNSYQSNGMEEKMNKELVSIN